MPGAGFQVPGAKWVEPGTSEPGTRNMELKVNSD